MTPTSEVCSFVTPEICLQTEELRSWRFSLAPFLINLHESGNSSKRGAVHTKQSGHRLEPTLFGYPGGLTLPDLCHAFGCLVFGVPGTFIFLSKQSTAITSCTSRPGAEWVSTLGLFPFWVRNDTLKLKYARLEATIQHWWTFQAFQGCVNTPNFSGGMRRDHESPPVYRREEPRKK